MTIILCYLSESLLISISLKSFSGDLSYYLVWNIFISLFILPDFLFVYKLGETAIFLRLKGVFLYRR